jgi:hypothetical protein
MEAVDTVEAVGDTVVVDMEVEYMEVEYMEVEYMVVEYMVVDGTAVVEDIEVEADGEHIITEEEVGVVVVGMVVTGEDGTASLTDGTPLLHSVIGIGGAIRYVL